MTESKGNNLNSLNARVMVPAFCTRLMLMKFREDSLNGFQVIVRTRFL